MKYFTIIFLTLNLLNCTSTIERVKDNKENGSSSFMTVKIIEMGRMDTFSLSDFNRRPRDPNVDYIILDVLIQNTGDNKIIVSAKPKIKLQSDKADSSESIHVDNCCNFLETIKANAIQLPILLSVDPLQLFELFEIESNQLALKTFYFPYPRNLSPSEFIFKAKLANDASYQEVIVTYSEVP
ncbi:hypothetical protein JWG40_19480 [Leptospira sp. 201903074]|uniref:hypothetical protein n=1 Tax=Leptospira abararensis TaxID=2810036 RepID=UPI0019630505|nr:hypothetical protein [Leptospira abararensis]MBM9549213.1 hypothetical protein [Leptospira abararensis]